VAEQYNITLTDGLRGAKNRPIQKKKGSDSAWQYLGIVGQIGYAVALPLSGGAIVGSLVDRKFGWYPKGTLFGLGVGFVVSIGIFIRVICCTYRWLQKK
jgi:hypothetical protein